MGYGYSDKPEPSAQEPNTIYNFDTWAGELLKSFDLRSQLIRNMKSRQETMAGKAHVVSSAPWIGYKHVLASTTAP